MGVRRRLRSSPSTVLARGLRATWPENHPKTVENKKAKDERVGKNEDEKAKQRKRVVR